METEGKKNQLITIALGLFFIFSNIASHTIYESISLLFLMTIGIIYILKTKKIYGSIYFGLYLIFIIYHIILILNGTAINKDVSYSMLQTLGINVIILIFVYNLIIHYKDFKGFSKVYVMSTIISLLLIIFLQRDTLLTGRLAHSYGEDSISYYFLGQAVSISANSISFSCAVSAALSIYLSKMEKKKSFLIYGFLLCIGVILTGSRKGILILALLLLATINLIYKKNIIKKVLFLICGGLLLWFLIMKIPAFYNILGERLLELINKILGYSTTEGSIIARERYKNFAFEMINNSPLYGYGLGYFKYLYGNVTESNYLEMIVSGGIIGLILYYISLIPIFVKYFLQKNKNDLLKLFFLIFISILIIDYGSVTYFSRSYVIFYVIILAILRLVKHDSNNNIHQIESKQ